MPPAPKFTDQSLVESLQPLTRSRKQRLTIGELMKRFEAEEGPGPVLMILTLPVLLPLPPGFSMVLALPLLMVTPQIAIGRKRLWAPKWLASRSFKRRDLTKLLHRVLPLLKRFETVARPRLKFLTGYVGARLVGLACMVLALVLVLPLPFANLVPALALGAFAIGLTRRDGLFVLGGYSLMALAAVVIVFGAHWVRLGYHALRPLI